MATNSSTIEVRKPRDMLKTYYGLSTADSSAVNNLSQQSKRSSAADGNVGSPCDINGSNFDPEMYLDKLLKEKTLTELVDKEHEMVRMIRTLDSDMQTLVYENYNKFISATDTIRKLLLLKKMKSDFKKMEDEMDNLCSAKQLTECVDLLLQLNEPADMLCDEFLTQAREKIEADLSSLELQLQLCSNDFQSLAKTATTTSPSVTTTKFPTTATEATTAAAAAKSKNKHSFDVGDGKMSENVLHERGDALDGNAYNVMDILEFVDKGCNGFLSNICLVVASYNDMFLARQQEDMQLDAIALKKLIDFVNELMARYFYYVKMRVQLEKATGNNMILVRSLDRFHRRLQAMNKLLPDSDFSSHNKGGPGAGMSFGEMVKKLHSSLIEQVKSVLNNLQAFIHPDITFAMKQHFRTNFCLVEVRENFVVAFIRHIIQTTSSIRQTNLTLVNEQFQSDHHYHFHHQQQHNSFQQQQQHSFQTPPSSSLPPTSSSMTSSSTLCSEARSAAQQILNHYVKVQGTRSERLSDSTARRSAASRLMGGGKAQWNYAPSTNMDSSLMSNIQKLFYEKIEVFTPVQFNRVSIMTGLIKICLKTLLECVRLKTFGRYGLQQMQVDCYYLQLYLWRYVQDENMVHILLDEVVSSTIHRCLDPVPMEASVVDVICDKN
ncbi:hypothetical protein HELRODRAFT_193892 [Helobdella robusta]|uniref:Vacuolar protein sorting-associated protein 51 homolog n=1 Tax=Helobdella robusta TaxID=6412 RepID=T1FVG3_HELRO|nr:hypothetical protein HELRODRAFT_193892 [Helobdella robusta]ESN93839.1 hypothetical protein HELRODRAFT_193892 [Helobdella robusta]